MPLALPPILMTYCPGSKCDPCKPAGGIQIAGNLSGENCSVLAESAIVSFPEFPVTVTASIEFLGVADPFTNNILHKGSGSTSTGGTANSLGVTCPLPETAFGAPAGWKYNLYSNEVLLFKATCTSSSTVGANLSVSTVDVTYQGGAIKVKWIGNVT